MYIENPKIGDDLSIKITSVCTNNNCPQNKQNSPYRCFIASNGFLYIFSFFYGTYITYIDTYNKSEFCKEKTPYKQEEIICKHCGKIIVGKRKYHRHLRKDHELLV